MNPTLTVNPLNVLHRHRSLLFELTKRDVLGRYRGASIGLFWSLISPFLMLLVYTLAFGYIMKSRWPNTDGSTSSFALILFAGLIVHAFFAECLVRAPQLIVGNSNLVKRVVFPLDALGWSMTFSALFHLFMNLAVLVALQYYWLGEIHVTTLLFPLVILPLLILTVGVGWIVSSLGVYFRDLGQVVGVLATAMLFLSSAIVPLDSVPDDYRWVFVVNPLTFVIDQARAVVLWGTLPDWQGLAFYSLAAMVVFMVGHAAFRRLSGGFADVL